VKSPKYLLYPFAILYGSIITIRNILFNLGILRSRDFRVWVISIGNLSTGGTGKSPHTEYIARLLEKLTRSYENLGLTFDKIGVLSRGYGRSTNGFLLVNNSSNAKEVGDEPMQLKRRLNNVYIGVDEKRVRGISLLMGLNPQLKIILLDDAFQHRSVKPTFSILLTNYNTPFYNDHMLPAGMLREPVRGYKRAQFIIVTDTPHNITDVEKKLIRDKINPLPKQKVFFSSIYYQSLVPLSNNNIEIPVIDKNYSIVLLTGIANPHSLYNHLAEMARDVVHISFPDHHFFDIGDVAKVMKAYNAITNPKKIIITTEKDFIRLQLEQLVRDLGTAPAFYLPIEVKVHDEQHFEDAFISNLSVLDPSKPIRKIANK